MALGRRRTAYGRRRGMNDGIQIRIWLAIAVAFVLILVLFQSILLPFVAGLILGYFLDPLADRLERWRVPRSIASPLLLVGFLLLVICGLLLDRKSVV